MNAIAFDTLAYVKRLREAGVDAQHAEAQAEALSLAISENLATSEELKSLELNLRAEIEKLGIGLRAEIRETQVTMIKWLVPLLLGQTAVLAAMVKLL